MDTSITPAEINSLDGLTVEQIAALDTIHEVLARILPDGTVTVPVSAFNSSI